MSFCSFSGRYGQDQVIRWRNDQVITWSNTRSSGERTGSVKFYVMQWGCHIFRKKTLRRCTVRFNVISVTRGGWMSNLQKKALCNTWMTPIMTIYSGITTICHILGFVQNYQHCQECTQRILCVASLSLRKENFQMSILRYLLKIAMHHKWHFKKEYCRSVAQCVIVCSWKWWQFWTNSYRYQEIARTCNASSHVNKHTFRVIFSRINKLKVGGTDKQFWTRIGVNLNKGITFWCRRKLRYRAISCSAS